MNSLKPIHLVTLGDVPYGGAAIARQRLIGGLKSKPHVGIRSYTAAVAGHGLEQSLSLAPDFFGDVLIAALRPMIRTESFERLKLWVLARKTRLALRDNDVILNLHNIHVSVGMDVLAQIPAQVPVVWTLHDMWALTGYCCYSMECCKYASEGCQEPCPQMGQWGKYPKSLTAEWLRRGNWVTRRKMNIVLVCPSKWLAECAQKRFPNVHVQFIPYGVDLSVFRPVDDRCSLRRAFGFSDEDTIILFAADSLRDDRKGISRVAEALKIIRNRGTTRVRVIMIGGGGNDAASTDGTIVCTGFVKDERLMNLYYNMADLHVLPSFADNLPNTLIETTASGTPSITFDVGGCPEVVENGITGFVSSEKTAAAIARFIESFREMNEAQVSIMRTLCRRRAETLYSIDRQADTYLELFQTLANGT